MPLIRAIRKWFGRRLSDATMYGTTAADGGASMSIASQLWLMAFIVLIPVIAVLVLIGLMYELVIRVDGRRLDVFYEWALSSALALALLAGLFVVVVSR